MRNRFFIPLILAMSLIAAACGSAADTATEGLNEAGQAVEELADDTVEEPAEEADAEPETTEEAPETTEQAEVTTTEAPEDTEPPADETTVPAPEEDAEQDTGDDVEEAPSTTEAVVDDVPAAPIDGQAIYESNCTRCHASDGSGGRGPSLQGIAAEQPDQSAGIAQTTGGGGGMPAFGERLTAEEIQATIDYIWDTF